MLNILHMIRLDYLSCVLTVLATVLIGKKLWQGWVVAGINSAVVCIIGIRTAQFGFVPATSSASPSTPATSSTGVPKSSPNSRNSRVVDISKEIALLQRFLPPLHYSPKDKPQNPAGTTPQDIFLLRQKRGACRPGDSGGQRLV
jgi:hypothetical protein